MKCPKCGENTLDPFDAVEGVDVDFCSGCKGIWFDKGELAFYAEAPEDVPDLASALQAGKSTGLACPRCESSSLAEVRYLPSESLLLDVCPSCHGVFVDRGELPKVESLAVKTRGLKGIGLAVKELEKRGYQILGAKKA